ncbi:hypothetical protein PQE75_gp069 [Bacillus phage vB_BcoS-136]|uniref:Uncharacterized protein n=1 Tax=Bacillus phage vB_BcoS-136 TaxID=2419619 RepID=A0A3G3BVM6_9CAUD|nr:hypothetical protein PQE75_gp069 [Bacillus phage vB_BcoS-136]AYP68201.1 hypothetical protein vBBcoS136_00069 [Bacillus phage vB_BcoS-136]
MAKEIVRENDYIYIYLLTVKDGKKWYEAKMKGLSVVRIGDNIDKLEKEFTDYCKDLIARFKDFSR